MEKHVFLPGRRGFTLIELMVVVAILGILMSAGIVMFSDAQKAARDAKRRADLDAIAKAMEQYYQNNGEYYYANINSLGTNWDDSTRRLMLGVFFASGSLPVDPVNNDTYYYVIRGIDQNRSGAANPQTRFCVLVPLENRKGNCAGTTGVALSNPNTYQCAFVTPGTGKYYCAQNRQ